MMLFCAYRIAIKNLKEVKDALGYFSDWNNLGLNLDLHPKLLEVISKTPGISDRVHEVLSNWLSNNIMNKQIKPHGVG